MSDRSNLPIGTILLIVGVAAASRLVPHPPNFTPLGAMALFGAAALSSVWLAVLIPLTALYLSDLVLNNVVYAQYQESFTWAVSAGTYLAFLAIIALGWYTLRKSRWTVSRIALITLGGTAIFFLLTNFLSWYLDPFQMYPDGPAGLAASYLAGLPFLLNSVIGDLFFAGLLFGAYEFFRPKSIVLA